MVDPDIAFAVCQHYRLNIQTLELIQERRSLLAAKIPGLSNMKDLYRCYQRYGKAIWAAADDFAKDTISLPDPNAGSFSTKKLPRPQANTLHLVASFPGAEKIKQLSDIGSLLAMWFIEDMSWLVVEDYVENKEDPWSGQYAKIWAPGGLQPEGMHEITNFDESLVVKLNRRLEA